MKLLLIEWLDHTTYATNEWRSLKDMQELTPALVTSVGFLVKETPDYLTLCATKTSDEAFTGEMCIIKKTIKKRRIIDPCPKAKSRQRKPTAKTSSKSTGVKS